MLTRSTSWAATTALLLFNIFVSGAIHDWRYQNSLAPGELSDATGVGVVPGYWILVPLLTVFVLLPATLVVSLLVVRIFRSDEAKPAAAMAGGPGPTPPPPSVPPPPTPSVPPPPPTARRPPPTVATPMGRNEPDGLAAQVFFLTLLTFSVAGHLFLAATDFAR